MINTNIHIGRVDPPGLSYFAVLPGPVGTAPPTVAERCLARLLFTACARLLEDMQERIAAGGQSGGGMRGDAKLVRRHLAGLAKGPPALMLSFICVPGHGSLYTAMYPPLPPATHPDVLELFRWIKSAVGFVTDLMRDDCPFDDPFTFQDRMLAALDAHLAASPPPAFLTP